VNPASSKPSHRRLATTAAEIGEWTGLEEEEAGLGFLLFFFFLSRVGEKTKGKSDGEGERYTQH
jgi:hypothetical protein